MITVFHPKITLSAAESDVILVYGIAHINYLAEKPVGNTYVDIIVDEYMENCRHEH